MPLNLNTSAQVGVFDTDTVTISRTTQVVSGAGATITPTTVTVWSGLADFQPRSGETYYAPGSDVVQTADAMVLIDPASDGTLPNPLVGDTVTVTTVAGKTTVVQVFDLVLVAVWTASPVHLELHLKQGGQDYRSLR